MAFVETEEILVIETPERVQLHFALASIGNRFLACAFDHLLQVIVLFLAFWGYYTLAGLTDLSFFGDLPRWIYATFIFIAFLILTCYFAFFEWFWNGQTPGKRLLKLRVIRDDGRPITFWEATTRNLLRIFDLLPTFPFYSVGLIAVFASKRDQRVGDFFAGTVVIRERAAEAPTFDEVFTAPTADAAYRRLQKPAQFTGDLSILTEKEIEVVEAFLRRRDELKDAPRNWMAWRVSMPILYKIKPSYDLATFSYEGFLEELLHRYRATRKYID